MSSYYYYHLFFLNTKNKNSLLKSYSCCVCVQCGPTTLMRNRFNIKNYGLNIPCRVSVNLLTLLPRRSPELHHDSITTCLFTDIHIDICGLPKTLTSSHTLSQTLQCNIEESGLFLFFQAAKMPAPHGRSAEMHASIFTQKVFPCGRGLSSILAPFSVGLIDLC